jgi:hypothetical protein
LFFRDTILSSWASTNVSINGKVLDESGLPIPELHFKGSSNATTTDFDGNYQKGCFQRTLIFSYLGYASIQEAINGRKRIDVKLQPTSQSLKRSLS